MNLLENVPRIIVDIDDTISTTVNRDYANAIPHTELINILNRLYDAGWEIVYFTARGQLSCHGDMDTILMKNQKILEDWLDQNNIKYTDLLFGKPYGALYLDDKAMRPSEFLKSADLIEQMISTPSTSIDISE